MLLLLLWVLLLLLLLLWVLLLLLLLPLLGSNSHVRYLSWLMRNRLMHECH